MANELMGKIDRGLRSMDLYGLADLYCRAHDREREAVEAIPRMFYRVIRRHIALAVSIKLEGEEEDDRTG